MQYKFKQLIVMSLTLVLLIGAITPSIVSAQGPDSRKLDLSYERYDNFIKEGVLGSDVSYEAWKGLVKHSYELENILEKSGNFKQVYSSEWIREKNSRFTLEKGDVVITNGTSSAGILGHAGIATSSSNILHIRGKGYNPEDMSLKDWHAKYTNKDSNSWTRVYRHTSSSIASAAANWVIRTYRNSNAEYKITANLASTSVTYCSKMVWQGYYYGPSSHNANGPSVGYRLPYDLPTTIHNLSYQHEY